MSVEQRRQVTEAIKVVVWVIIGICSFLMKETYQEQQRKLQKIGDEQEQNVQKIGAQLEKIDNKVESIESRLIRTEYELKLK